MDGPHNALDADRLARLLEVRARPCHVPGHYMAGQHIPFTVTG